MGAIVRRLAATPGPLSGESILTGELEDIALPTLLHLLEIESLCGWVLVDSAHRIDFHRGRVTAASAGSKEGVEGLKEILVTRGARFDVFRGIPREERALERVSSTVLDAYQILDEWEAIADLVLRLVGDQRWRPTGRVIDHFMGELDATSSLRELVARTGISLCVVVDEVPQAKKLGLVVEVAPAPTEEEEEVAPAMRGADAQIRQEAPQEANADLFTGVDFFELLDRARVSIKGRDYSLAKATLEAALKLRPGDRVAGQNLRRVRQLMS